MIRRAAVDVLMNRAALLAIACSLLVLCAACGHDDHDDDDDQGEDPEGDVVSDPQQGLMWQIKPTADYLDWQQAEEYCASLSYAGYGNWRLPTISELRSLIRGCLDTESGGACRVEDDCLGYDCANEGCDGCLYGNGPADGCYWPAALVGDCFFYWTSSEVEDYEVRVWTVYFNEAFISPNPKVSTCDYYGATRCVRSL
ncbi:MAG: DUF1566 domain-containing protein [Candidatus Alcyoniella australis]|nr:DUF1566 domain-containing protein [Candidatus Alcyoniella australis]